MRTRFERIVYAHGHDDAAQMDTSLTHATPALPAGRRIKLPCSGVARIAVILLAQPRLDILDRLLRRRQLAIHRDTMDT